MPGAWVLVPPLLAIGLALWTRRVHQSLLLGLLSAGVLMAWQDLPPQTNAWGLVLQASAALYDGTVRSVAWIIEGIARPGNAAIFTFILILGAIVGLLHSSGAMQAFAERALTVAPTRRRAGVLAWLTGSTVLAIDDHFNVVTSGTLFGPLFDRLVESRAKLAYIIDSTGAPVAILNPVSTWAGFMVTFTAGALAAVGADADAFTTFLKSIPWNLYGWATLLFVLLVAATGRDFGPMRTAHTRPSTGPSSAGASAASDAASSTAGGTTGRAQAAPGAALRPARALDLLLPLLFLSGSAVLILWATGHVPGASFRQSIASADAPLSLAVATFLTLAFTAFAAMRRGMRQDDVTEAALAGARTMLPVLVVLALAFALGIAVQSIGLGTYVAATLGPEIAPGWLPLAVFVASAIIAFATGTSFGTYAIMIPLGIGLAAGMPDPITLYAPVLAAVAGGGVFGDHCSPVSDTTVLSSMAARCDHVEHVRTQLPYALAAATTAGIGYALHAWGAGPAWILPVTLAATTALFFALARGGSRDTRPAGAAAAKEA